MMTNVTTESLWTLVLWVGENVSILSTAGTVLLVVFALDRWLRDPLRNLPGPSTLPFLGNVHQIDRSAPHKTLAEWAKKYGDVFCFSLFGKRTVVLSSAEVVRQGLLKQAAAYSGRPQTFTISYIIYGAQDIACQDACAKQRLMRKVGISTLKAYATGMERLEKFVADELCDILQTLAKVEGEPVDVRPLLHASVSSIMTSIILGKRCRASDEEVDQLITVIRYLNDEIHPTQGALLDMFPWLRHFGNSCFKKMQEAVSVRDKFVNKLFDTLKATYDPNNMRGMIDVLLASQMNNNNNQNDNDYNNDGDSTTTLSDQDLKAIIFDLIGTGTNSTSPTVCCFILALLNHPEVQAKLADEIDKVVGNARMPCLKDRPNMPYTEAAMMEVLRYYSLSPMLVPRTTTTDTTLSGYTIPAKTQVVVNAWSILHDERFYDDPWSFYPERFLDEDGLIVPLEHPAKRSFVPFGIGSRSCIGENLAKTRLFLFMTSLCQRFTFVPVDVANIPSDDPNVFPLGYSLQPETFRVRAIDRLGSAES